MVLQTLQRDPMSSNAKSTPIASLTAIASNAPTRSRVFQHLPAASVSCPHCPLFGEVALEGTLLHLSKKGSCVCFFSRVRLSRREAVLLPTTAGLLDHFIMAVAYA